ncbi:MAG: hypothetical protein NTY07_02315 [Bacteroidia bacterium]|nr:hypothetical protein [Bacteroidia bacterium]
MKKAALISFFMVVALFDNTIAQPFLQLVPQKMFKEEVKFTNADWAGFYLTSKYDEIGQGMMVLLPVGDSIVGFCASEDAGYIRILKGKLNGNGIRYNYETLALNGNLKSIDHQKGEGFMVMKDDGKKENVYCKHGDAKGMQEVKGCFTAGKKQSVELNQSQNSSDYDWSGIWSCNEKKETIPLELDKLNDCYYGYYTLKSFKIHEKTTRGMYWDTETYKVIPKSAVFIFGIPLGECLYYLAVHKDGSQSFVGIFTMASDKKSIKGIYVDKSDMKNLGKKGETLNFTR